MSAVAIREVALAPALAFAVALGITTILARSSARRFVLDEPNARSLHARPVPRTGGLGVLAGCVAGWLLPAAVIGPAIVAGSLILGTMSFIDDLRSLPVVVRLFVHLATALGIVLLLAPSLPLLLMVAAILAIAWLMNLYNFMDGSDGLAGGMAIAGFFFYGCAAWRAGNPGFAVANWVIAAAAGGFLVFNFHPARIFMGDAGSVPLGFLAGALGLVGWVRQVWPLWFPVLVFSPFIVDASVTLARRLWRRERVWQAHRDHYYQRLVRLGWGHRGTAWAEYALMVACGSAGLFALHASGTMQQLVLGAVAVVYLLAMLAIDAAWRNAEARSL